MSRLNPGLGWNNEWRAPGNRFLLRFIGASLLVHAAVLSIKMTLPGDAPKLPKLQITLSKPPAPMPKPVLLAKAPPPVATPQAQPKAKPEPVKATPAKPEAVRHVPVAMPTPTPIMTSSAATAAPAVTAPPVVKAQEAPPPKLAEAPVVPSAPAVPVIPPYDFHADLSSYGRQYTRYLAQHRIYPRLAQMRGMEGQVLVHIRVARKGSVIDMVVARSSGFDILDQQALDMVRQAAPLPNLPASLAEREFSLDVPIVFRLEQS